MEAVLDDNGLKEFIDTDIPKPTDATQADAWQKKTAKSWRILLEGMKDHIVSSLHGGFSILDVESIDRFIPKQERLEEIGAQG